MAQASILWVEGRRFDHTPFIPDLRKKGYSVETAPSGRAALVRMSEFLPDILVVNAASMRTSGKQICRLLRKQTNGLPIILIGSADKIFSGETCANEVLIPPFTTRKLANRIAALLPGNGQKLRHAGPIHLDLERKTVHCQGKESHLTPRLVELLRILMQRPGEVIEREHLFCQAWRTDYTGDTRSLDVHISWLRQAIEEDPRRPLLLKTVRGVGYRLDI